LFFSGIILVWAGGFILLWLYGEDWFFNFSDTGSRDLRDFLPDGESLI
jgi:copper/silver efflux system protein